MSKRKQQRQSQREAREERQAKKVITWIFSILILFAIAFLAVFMFQDA